MKFSPPAKNNEGLFTSVVTNDNDSKVMTRLDNVNYLTGKKFHVGTSQLEVLGNVDQQVLNYAKEHKQEWFGRDNIQDGTINKAFQESAEEEFFEPQYATTKSGKAVVKYYDHNNESLKGTEEEYNCSLFLQLTNIWFTKRNFGIGWKLLQVKINKPEEDELTADDDYPEDCLF